MYISLTNIDSWVCQPNQGHDGFNWEINLPPEKSSSSSSSLSGLMMTWCFYYKIRMNGMYGWQVMDYKFRHEAFTTREHTRLLTILSSLNFTNFCANIWRLPEAAAAANSKSRLLPLMRRFITGNTESWKATDIIIFTLTIWKMEQGVNKTKNPYYIVPLIENRRKKK